MVCRLMDFAFVVLRLLMFKVCGIIGISKIEFFKFSGTEKVNGYFSPFGAKPTKQYFPGKSHLSLYSSKKFMN